MHGVPGGMGTASVRVGDATVGAVAVVNAIGDVIGADGQIVAGSTADASVGGYPDPPLGPGENTTLVVVATDARCTKVQCHLVAQSAHEGLARSLSPVATRYDGDITFGLATGAVDVHFDRLRLGVVDAVATAVRSAVSSAPA
jgi:L-aminopeptidase/D-esterase-like protein